MRKLDEKIIYDIAIVVNKYRDTLKQALISKMTVYIS